VSILVWPIFRLNKLPAEYCTNRTRVISTVSRSQQPWCQLSPFLLGPCELYDGITSRNMENAWQYSKVYPKHIRGKSSWPYTAEPNGDYWKWAHEGWNNPKAVRYPMGKGKKPEFSWWEGKPYNYIAARKKIYGPLYAEAVKKTEAFELLMELKDMFKHIVLLDYDAYDHKALDMSLVDVLNCPDRKMGHAFVLKMLLIDSAALRHMELR
jgi:hypothetical protein